MMLLIRHMDFSSLEDEKFHILPSYKTKFITNFKKPLRRMMMNTSLKKLHKNKNPLWVFIVFWIKFSKNNH